MDVVFLFVESRVYLGLVQYDDLACGMVGLVCRHLMVARLRIYLCQWIVRQQQPLRLQCLVTSKSKNCRICSNLLPS